DGHVTGVQTCALPIYAVGFVAVDDALRTIPSRWPDAIVVELRTLGRREAERLFGASIPVIGIAPASHELWIDELPFARVLRRPRSEERRVGKEGRRWG